MDRRKISKLRKPTKIEKVGKLEKSGKLRKPGKLRKRLLRNGQLATLARGPFAELYEI